MTDALRETMFLLKLAVLASALCTLLVGIFTSPIWIGLIVEHGHPSGFWALGLPISGIPVFIVGIRWVDGGAS